MKQLINKLFGVYATSKNVQGKKSQGTEDRTSAHGSHWKLRYGDDSSSNIN